MSKLRHALQLQNEIHLWSASLSEVRDANESILDRHERQRAEQFRMEEPRLRYIQSHWLLRRILSEYVHERADRIRFAYRDKGKLYLPDHTLYCSLSRSHDRWIVALTRDGEIGADIEKLAPLAGMDTITRRYWHGNERDKLLLLDAKQRTVAFYQYWTQMEAFVKMHGMGLHARMNTIRRTDGGLMFEDEPASRAACDSYPIHPDYIASIAVKGPMPPVVRLEWTSGNIHSREE